MTYTVTSTTSEVRRSWWLFIHPYGWIHVITLTHRMHIHRCIKYLFFKTLITITGLRRTTCRTLAFTIFTFIPDSTLEPDAIAEALTFAIPMPPASPSSVRAKSLAYVRMMNRAPLFLVHIVMLPEYMRENKNRGDRISPRSPHSIGNKSILILFPCAAAQWRGLDLLTLWKLIENLRNLSWYCQSLAISISCTWAV